MDAVPTNVYTMAIQDSWAAAILAETDAAIPSSIRSILSDFVLSLSPSKINLIGSYSAAGSGDCASYDCSGGTSTGTWCHVYDLTSSANGFTGFDLEGNGSVGVWVPGVGFRASANSDGNSYGDIQGDLPVELHVTTVRIQGTGSNNRGGAFGCWLTGPHAAGTTPRQLIPGAGAYDITLTVNDLGNHLKVFQETAHYGDGYLSTISTITLVGDGDYPTSFNNC